MPERSLISFKTFYENNSDLIIKYPSGNIAVKPRDLEKRCEELKISPTTKYTFRCPIDWTTYTYNLPRNLRPINVACPSAHDWEACTPHTLSLVKSEDI